MSGAQIFVSLRDGPKSRFVSAASDDTRKGETKKNAPLRRSLKVRADSDVSIALAAIRHRRSFRGRAKGAMQHDAQPSNRLPYDLMNVTLFLT